MCSQAKLNMLISQIVVYSKEVFGDKFRNVILYGSYARGDYDDESDIDIMIMVDMEPEELKAYRKKMVPFIADLNLKNDVFMVSKLQSLSFFHKWKDTIPFYQNVLKDGVVYA